MSDFGKTLLSVDLWREIAKYLTDDELKTLQQISRFFNNDVLYTNAFLQPVYNRLHALDTSLPALLPQNNLQVTLIFRRFGEYFSRIAFRQAEEMAYLKTHHPAFFTEQVNAILDQESLTLEILEQKSVILDAINSHIIEKEIIRIHEGNLKRTTLNISKKNITRVPRGLMTNEQYTEFWKNLKKLSCGLNPALYSLNVQMLTNLKELDCSCSGLEFLDIRGLKNLVKLGCGSNRLSYIDFQGVDNLISLACGNNKLHFLNVQNLCKLGLLNCVDNPLTHLDLQGKDKLKVLLIINCPLQDLNLEGVFLEEVPLHLRNELKMIEERLLFNQLLNCGVSDLQTKEKLVRRLGDRYNYGNCEKHLGKMSALSIFACETIASATSQLFSFAMFRSKKIEKESIDEASLKRKREEQEDKDDEPKKKRDKKNPPKG